jgi:hypothetical protein
MTRDRISLAEHGVRMLVGTGGIRGLMGVVAANLCGVAEEDQTPDLRAASAGSTCSWQFVAALGARLPNERARLLYVSAFTSSPLFTEARRRCILRTSHSSAPIRQALRRRTYRERPRWRTISRRGEGPRLTLAGRASTSALTFAEKDEGHFGCTLALFAAHRNVCATVRVSKDLVVGGHGI